MNQKVACSEGVEVKTGALFSVADDLASSSSALRVPTRRVAVSPVRGSGLLLADGVGSMRSSLTGCCWIVFSTDGGVSGNWGAISSPTAVPLLGRVGVSRSRGVWGLDSKASAGSSNPDALPNNSVNSTMTPHLMTAFFTYLILGRDCDGFFVKKLLRLRGDRSSNLVTKIINRSSGQVLD